MKQWMWPTDKHILPPRLTSCWVRDCCCSGNYGNEHTMVT